MKVIEDTAAAVGNQQVLARLLGVSPAMVSRVKTRHRLLPKRLAIRLMMLADRKGVLTEEHLRELVVALDPRFVEAYEEAMPELEAAVAASDKAKEREKAAARSARLADRVF